ncbi:MAG: serpin family protein [Longimicrobiales bacterium]
MTSRPFLRACTGALLPALLLSACGDPVGPGAEEITELPRALTSSEKAVIQSGNSFGLELMRQVAARDMRPNVVLSPLSASMALGMALNGADGATFDAMRSTLGFGGLGQAEINGSYRSLLELLTGLDPQVRFDIANSVWANKNVPFHAAFLQAVQAAFDATVESRDFADAATLEAINAWVKANTGGLIEKILDQLDPSMAAILINAIYFDGTWTSSFDPAKTKSAAFTRENGSAAQVDMMNLSGATFPFGGGADYTAVELPYGGQAFSMVVVVPNGGTTARAFLKGLDAARWEAILQGLTPREVDQVSIPKFTLAFDTYLNDPLIAMGMGPAFRSGADFTKMSPDGVCIDYVRQKTYIDVDEKGTKAAAVTAVGMRVVSFTGLIADRPFVFAIRERLSGTLLFVGLVGDPTFEDSGEGELGEGCR